MILLAVFQVLLHYYTGRDDIVVGTDVANRNRIETEGLIGFFVNQLVLRTDLSGNPSFRALLTRVREVTLGAYAHQDIPFEHLVHVLNPRRSRQYSPFFQVKIILMNVPINRLELPGLVVTPEEIDIQVAKYDLLVGLWEEAGRLLGFINYNTDLFDVESISRLSRQFEIIFRAIVGDNNATLTDLENILTDDDRKQQQIRETELQQVRIRKLHESKRKPISQSHAPSVELEIGAASA